MEKTKDEKAAQVQSESNPTEATATPVTDNPTKKESVARKETAAKSAAKKIAKGIFAASPAIKVVHIASDGVAFYTLGDAKNYARSLKNKEVISLRREDIK